MTLSIPTDGPAPLKIAAVLVVVEGLALVVYGVLELAHLSTGRMAMGLTSAGFMLLYAAGLGLCAWFLLRGQSWARSPIVLAQLIQLGVAWSFRGGETTIVAVVLALVALGVLVGIMHPASVQALAAG